MNYDNAFNQASNEYHAVISSLIPRRISEFKVQPESPIEMAFLIGLMSMSYTTPCYRFDDAFSRFAVAESTAFPTITVELQAPVETYRADFLLTVTHKGQLLGKVVVECDGHAFHERTKEQAAHDRYRDRTMTLAGYKVMRFTGSEIHRKLMECVSDAHEAAWHFYEGPSKP